MPVCCLALMLVSSMSGAPIHSFCPLPRWEVTGGGGSLDYSLNKLTSLLPCVPNREVLGGCLLLVYHSRGHRGGEEEEKKKQLLGKSEGNRVKLQLPGLVIIIFELDSQSVVESAVGGAHQQWFVGSYAAHAGGRRAVSFRSYAAHQFGRLAVFLPPLLLLVEWQPSFLPASVPIGRQQSFLSASMEFFHGNFVVPSGVIPGGGEVLVQDRLWFRLRSPSDVRGLLCKRQGPLCNFLFPLDQYVRCTLFILI